MKTFYISPVPPPILIYFFISLRLNDVFSIIKSPSTNSCGSIPITKIIEITVPLPSEDPTEAITGFDEKSPMENPAHAWFVPYVIMVGKAKLSDCCIALNLFIFLRNSVYLFVITIA